MNGKHICAGWILAFEAQLALHEHGALAWAGSSSAARHAAAAPASTSLLLRRPGCDALTCFRSKQRL